MQPSGVSVVIVNWNTRDKVVRLLKRLTSPEPADRDAEFPLELIIVDNDSSDGSVEAIEAEFSNVKLVAQRRNAGFAGGVNPGVRMATLPLVLLLNSDALTTRASIAEAAQYMRTHPEVGVLGPKIVDPEGSPQSSCWRDPSLSFMLMSALGLSRIKALNFERYGEKVFDRAVAVDCVCGCAMMIRRDLLTELEGLDEDYFMYFEETDFCVRARRRGEQVHYAPVGDFVHEQGGTSKTVRLRTFLDFRRSEILFHTKHGGTTAGLAARALLVLKSAVRVPPLWALSALGGSRRQRAATELNLHLNGLRWLLQPTGGLVPNVDREEPARGAPEG